KGLIILVPIFITFFVLRETYELTEGLLGSHFTYYFPGLGFIVCVLAILLTGYLFSHWMLEGLLGFCERLIGTIPIVNFIYQSVKKLSEAVFDSKQLFNQAVLVTYPGSNARVLGFKVKEDLSPIMGQDGVEYACVFVPWSLNMTSGINVMVPTKDLIPVDISSEEALQYILTAGSIIPNRPPKMTIVADGKTVGQTEAETEPQTTEREIETGSKEKQAVSE
ncbi:MAG: DUF502 domain-containing protein, partial [Selenomonadales bacterium]|nr:DUF502 domain-containing protein [Selenomonadales bacterium]